MENIDFCSWKLNFNLEIKEQESELNEILINMCNLSIFKDGAYLLNKDNINNVLERLINEISSFHLKKKNILYDEKIFVEFWFKTNADYNKNINYLHVDKSEYERDVLKKNLTEIKHPISSLVLYLNDNDSIPTIITSITNNDIINNKPIDSKQFVFSFPRKNTIISFDGGKYYHGQININNNNQERYILVINIWNTRPTKVPYFNYDVCIYQYGLVYKKDVKEIIFKPKQDFLIENEINNSNSINFIENNKILKINSENLLTDNLFNALLSFKNIDEYYYLFLEFNNIMLNKINEFSLFFFIEENNSESFKEVDINYQKFKQRFVYNNYFTSEICNWIVYESEEYARLNGGWSTERHALYPTTDIPIDKIKNIFNFLIYAFKESIASKIIKDYNLKRSAINFNVSDAFIVKYEEGKQCHLDMHDDDSTITSTILLSNNNDYVGGGVLFEDELQYNLNIGDMLIHCGKSKHSSVKITKGKRYVLVFFIKIFTN
jgi:hypothetical protein